MLVGVNLGRFTATRQTNAVQAQGRELLLDSARRAAFVSSPLGLEKYRSRSCRASGRTSPTWAKTSRRDLVEGQAAEHEYAPPPVLVRRRGARTARRGGWCTTGTRAAAPSSTQNLAANLQMLEELLQAGPRARRARRARRAAAQRARSSATASPPSQRQYQVPVTALAGKYDVPYLDVNETLAIPNARLPRPLASGRARARHLAACTGEGARRRSWRRRTSGGSSG